MELFDLPVSLLASIVSYLRAESLLQLDSAVCNHDSRPSMLEAFARCHIDYEYFGRKRPCERILWLVQKKIKIASLFLDEDQSCYVINHEAELAAFLSMFTTESTVSIMNGYPFDIVPHMCPLLPALKLLKCECLDFDRVSADCLIHFNATTPIHVTYIEYAEGDGLIAQLSDRRFDHILTEVQVFYDEAFDLADIDHHFDTTVCYPNLHRLVWEEAFCPVLLKLIRASPSLQHVKISHVACGQQSHNLLDDIGKLSLKTLTIEKGRTDGAEPAQLLQSFSLPSCTLPTTLQSLSLHGATAANMGLECIALLTSLKVLELRDIEITAEQLQFVLSHFPMLDELSLVRLKQCHTTAYLNDILKHRGDKTLQISLWDDEDSSSSSSYDDLMPSEGTVFKEHAQTLKLNLLNKATCFHKAEKLMLQVLDMFCSGGGGIVYPYSNLQSLIIQGLPIRSNNLHTLCIACPKLHSLTLQQSKDSGGLFRGFMLTTFPVDWPSLRYVHLSHAYASIECLKMIIRCPCMADITVYRRSLSAQGEYEGGVWDEIVEAGKKGPRMINIKVYFSQRYDRKLIQMEPNLATAEEGGEEEGAGDDGAKESEEESESNSDDDSDEDDDEEISSNVEDEE